MRHYYVFTYRANLKTPIYESTFPELKYAKNWLKDSKYKGFITVDSVPSKFFY